MDEKTRRIIWRIYLKSFSKIQIRYRALLNIRMYCTAKKTRPLRSYWASYRRNIVEHNYSSLSRQDNAVQIPHQGDPSPRKVYPRGKTYTFAIATGRKRIRASRPAGYFTRMNLRI